MDCGLRKRITDVRAIAFVLLALAFASTAQALTVDVTSQFAITRTEVALNKATKTFDQTVTLTNRSGSPAVGPLKVVIRGLRKTTDLVNQAGQTPDGDPYVVPLAAGAIAPDGSPFSFVLAFTKLSQFARNSTLQVLYTVEAPPGAPSLIGVVPTGPTSARVVGRVDGVPNQAITVQAHSAATCVAGTLVGGAATGGEQSTTTDRDGYFAIDISSVSAGAFVSVKLISPRSSGLSLCLVNARDNDAWPKAFPLDGAQSAQDYIDSPGRARWYRFAVVPDQRIAVSLTGLPADYDVVVFNDIGQAFLTQFNPSTATTSDLLKLAAEYAPSIFSPSIFSPSIFSPDAYTPSIFSPSIFSPSIFSPDAYTPSIFSPSIFSPSIFSPSIFSPSIFSPSIFSPSIFSPSIFSPDEIAKAFSTAQARSVISVAATPGTASETTVVNTWTSTGSFYVRVTGRNDAFSTTKPFTLTVSRGATSCATVTDTEVIGRTAKTNSGLTSLILVDSGKLAIDDDLSTTGGGSLREKLASFARRNEVNGIVVDVGNDVRVKTLKQQAEANPACPFAKNLVAGEIKRIVDTYRANPLRYVVIVGNDDAIPFFRIPDRSQLGEESGYVPPVESNSASEAGLRRNYVLTQDPYGSSTKLSIPSSEFPVPGLAVGRLVETIDEIAGMINAYVSAQGVIVPATSLVTGYDFLADAANAVQGELQLGTGKTADTLITPSGISPQAAASWTATQLGQALLGKRHDLVFLAGHFSANSALAADFTTSLLTTDLAVSTVDLANAVVFSAGCHAGFNLVDADAIPGVTMQLDWAQAFARKRATLIAGTGYQYGDTDFLEYSERLYRNFARELRAGNGALSIGEVLVKAKLDYLSTTTDIRGIHEKALLEATLFGLPMLGINMPAGRGAVPSVAGVIAPTPVASGPAATLGLKTHDLSIATSFTTRTLSLTNVTGSQNVVATWLDGPDGVVSKPGEPVLPLAAVNVTPVDSSIVLRGVGFRGGSFVDTSPLVPFSGAATTELRGVHVPFAAPVFYPGRLWSPNYFGALAGVGGTQLLVTPTQHRVLDSTAGTSTQRRYPNLNVRLYYSGNRSQAALSDAPSIVGVEDEKAGVDALFSVQVVGDPAAAVHSVWVTWTSEGSGTWASLDLRQCVAPLPADCASEDSRVWKGRLANAPANARYFVQAVSGIGLVALDDNLGAYYGISAVAPTATTLALVSVPATSTVGDTVNVKVRLTAGDAALTGKAIVVSAGGIAQVGTTAIDGTVTVKLPANADPGVYTIAASFAGDDDFLASSVTSPFQITQAVAQLTPLSPAGVTLTGTIGGTTSVVQQTAVSFTVTGPDGPTTIWAITDALGRAVLPPPGLSAGAYQVTGASFAGNGTFAPTTVMFGSAQQFDVAKVAQTIAFDALPDRSYGYPPFNASAIATSGLPVSLVGIGSCIAEGTYVQITALGTCTVTAGQAGDGVYEPAQPIVSVFNVTPADQNIVFGPAPVSVSAGQPLVMVSATSTSPAAPPSAIPITFSSQTPSVCSVDAGPNSAAVTLLAPGTCTIAADQAGDGLYNPGGQATQSFVVGAPSAPATFVVTNLNDSGAGSLRAAIASANATPGADIVTFAPDVTGTIVLTSGGIQVSGPTEIVGPGADVLTIDGNANNRIFTVLVTSPACPAVDPGDYLVRIAGLRLTNGRRNVADSCGGAIYAEHSLALDSVQVENSMARCGGGLNFTIQYPGQTLTIANSRFLDNTATEVVPPLTGFDNHGGAVNFSERCPNALDTPYTKPVTVNITGSEFRGNSAQPLTGRDGRGGALRSWSLADVYIADTAIVDNHVIAPNPPAPGFSYHGGGFDGTVRSLRIERTEFSDNTAFDATGSDATRSGAMHLHNTAVDRQDASSTMRVRIVNSTISGNLSSATAGAGIVTGNIAYELVNSTLTNNTAAPTRTGGLAASIGNTDPASGSRTHRPSLTFTSSILADNSSTGGDFAASLSGNIASMTIASNSSLIRRPCPAPSCTLSFVGVGNLFDVDPLLGPLQNNGGPTRTHALLPGSPAVNAGGNPLGLLTDQRGAGSPREAGGRADIGAYESP